MPANGAGVATVGVDPDQDIFPRPQLTCSNSRGPFDWHTHSNSAQIGDVHGYSLMYPKLGVMS